VKKILVTGATGRIGANLIKRLLEKNYKIRAFVMENDPKIGKLKPFNIEIVYGNLLDFKSIKDAVNGVDGVIHLAAIMVKPKNMARSIYFDINVKGTFFLTEAANEYGKIEKFIFSSTDATYSALNPKYLPINEVHPRRPYFLYSLVKVLGEEIVLESFRENQLPVTILRLGSVMAGDEVLNLFRARVVIKFLKEDGIHPSSCMYVKGVKKPWELVEKIIENEEQLIIPLGLDGRSWRIHPTDVRDTVEGIILALESDAAIGEVFNILGPSAVTWEQAVKYIAKKTGEDYVKCKLPNYWEFEIDISKAKTILNYNPKYDIYKMVDSALAYQKGEDIGVIST